MSEFTLTKTRMLDGVWEGVLTSDMAEPSTPRLIARHLNVELPDLDVIDDPEAIQWLVRLPVPISSISDGVQTFVIVDQTTDEKLASFSVLAGESLADDIRAEVDLLRAELDMLKRAFRRHCVETA